MKLSKLLYDYLATHKELTLQGLGHFTLTPSTALMSSDKEPVSIGEITFSEDKKAGTSEKLVDFISREAGKMKPLATSDLDSYLELGKQLLNISKPFSIDGIGTLLSNAKCQLEFVQGDAIIHGEENNPSKKLRHEEKGEIHFEHNYLQPGVRKVNRNRNLAIFSLATLGIVLIGWVAWYFYPQNAEPLRTANEGMRNQETAVSAQPASYQEPQLQNPIVQDSIEDTRDTVRVAQSTIASVQSASKFDLVVEVSQKNRAYKRYADLKEWGHNVKMTTADSLTFKLSIPVEAPLADSTRHRDSLSRFFGRKVWIETH